MAYYTVDELSKIGFKSYGDDVKISRSAVFYHPERIELGNHVRIDDFASLSACQNGFIKIGSYVHIAAFVMIEATHGVIMEDFAGLAARVLIFGASDNYNGEYLTGPTVSHRYRGEQGALVRVGRHVVVGAATVLLPGASIGDGSAVGALSLVKKPLPAGGIFVGVPATLIAKRSHKVFELERVFLSEGSDEEKRNGEANS
jgi:galactoside O-acetyltransferase